MKVFNTVLPQTLHKFWRELGLVFNLMKDYFSGDYKDVSWKVFATLAAAAAYLISPVDVIPDVILGVGVLDDALVLKLALDFISEDLYRYERWKGLKS